MFEKYVSCLECYCKSKERAEFYLNSGTLDLDQAYLLFDVIYKRNHEIHLNTLEDKYAIM